MTLTLIHIAFALAAGLLMTRVFKAMHFNFPDVTVYLITGLLIGPFGLGRFGVPGVGFSSMDAVKALEIVSTVALGFIAFSIGNEFKLSQLKGIGKQATIIGILQAVAATVIVDMVLVTVAVLSAQRLSTPAAITLGAIAAATAPAATLMVVRQYKAQGKLTSLLLPIVALDDAVGLVIFAVSFGVAQALLAGSVSVVALVINPLIEICASIVLGAVLGWVLTKLEELFFSNTNRLSLTIAFVFVTIAFSQLSFKVGAVTVSFSSLLVCMMLGTVLCNLCPRSGDIMHRADGWTAPINVLFFVLSGAELDLTVISNPFVVGVGVLYIIARSAGKYFGARYSAALTGCDEKTSKYLGYTLLPQAGVALGMSAQAVALGGVEGTLVRNIILFSVLIYELAGPSITRWALTQTGDIVSVPKEKTSHARFNTPKEHRKK
ncbi:MAG: cation:proton antiporter [Sphaerochaetaceae bacterium]|nr:cation:proton antiporter [Sphaerochaetaceae bacterium]